MAKDETRPPREETADETSGAQRLTVLLRPDQVKMLENAGAARGESMSAVLRCVVDEELARLGGSRRETVAEILDEWQAVDRKHATEVLDAVDEVDGEAD
jgi:hypothetical protein